MILVLFGPPGVGKGTQGRRIVEECGVPKISTGAIFRDLAAAGTEMGLSAKSYWSTGQLVPDKIVVGLVKERISEPDCLNGFIMDGFPRTVAQAKIFDGILSENGLKVDGVINLQANEEALTQRLSGRRTCDNCGATFHIDSMPSKQAGVCDYCGHALVQRNDDNPESIRIRLREYNKKTEPVIDFYQNANVLRNVDGERVPDDVFADVAKIIKECGCKAPALAVV